MRKIRIAIERDRLQEAQGACSGAVDVRGSHSRASGDEGGNAFSHALNMSMMPGADLGGVRRSA